MPRQLVHAIFVTAMLLLGGSTTAAAQQTQGTAQAPGKAASKPLAKAPAPPKARLVDINSASRAELKTLPGIGDAEADRIIAARPYPSKAKLAADKVLSLEAYAALKGRIVAVQKAQPKAKAKAQADARP